MTRYIGTPGVGVRCGVGAVPQGPRSGVTTIPPGFPVVKVTLRSRKPVRVNLRGVGA